VSFINLGEYRPVLEMLSILVSFEWVTPGIRIWPVDLLSSKLWSLPGTSSPPGPDVVHFIGSPSRSVDVLSQIEAIHSGELGHGFGKGWDPTILFEPFPVSLSTVHISASALAHSPSRFSCTVHLHSRKHARLPRHHASDSDILTKPCRSALLALPRPLIRAHLLGSFVHCRCRRTKIPRLC
jgi:hypothetical protein